MFTRDITCLLCSLHSNSVYVSPNSNGILSTQVSQESPVALRRDRSWVCTSTCVYVTYFILARAIIQLTSLPLVKWASSSREGSQEVCSIRVNM